MGSVSLSEILSIGVILAIKAVFLGAVVYGAIFVYHRFNKVKK